LQGLGLDVFEDVVNFAQINSSATICRPTRLFGLVIYFSRLLQLFQVLLLARNVLVRLGELFHGELERANLAGQAVETLLQLLGLGIGDFLGRIAEGLLRLSSLVISQLDPLVSHLLFNFVEEDVVLADRDRHVEEVLKQACGDRGVVVPVALTLQSLSHLREMGLHLVELLLRSLQRLLQSPVLDGEKGVEFLLIGFLELRRC